MSISETEIKTQPSYLRDPDVALMLRVKAGDEAAFEKLVTSYQDRLVSVFYHLVRDRSTAEDLAQETFLRVYRARLGYEPKAKFSTWLFHIAHNLASNKRRDRGRRKEVDLNPSDSGPMGARPEEQILKDKSAMMPTRQVAKSELQTIVQGALSELNERQQMAVLLNKFEGMSYADIATTMELTPAAVKSLLSRARETLRGKLESYVR